MPAQPELLLTAKRVDVAGFGEVGSGGVHTFARGFKAGPNTNCPSAQ